MSVINLHGAGDRGSAGGGPSALNGVGQKIQDILNQLYNAGGSSGAFASAQAQLSGISPGLAGMLGSGTGGAAEGVRGAGGRGGAGGVGAVGGPSTVNINVKVADIGLGNMDSTLNKILEALKTGQGAGAAPMGAIAGRAAQGARAARAPEVISVTPEGQGLLGPAAVRSYTRQKQSEANAQYRLMRADADHMNRQIDQKANQNFRSMRLEADTANKQFDKLYGPNPSRRFPTIYNRPNWTFGGSAAGGGGGPGGPGGPGAGGLVPFTPDPYRISGLPPLNLKPGGIYTKPPVDIKALMAPIARGAGDLAKLGTGFLLAGAAGIPYSNFAATAAGLGIRSGAGVGTIGSIYGNTGTVPANLANVGISPQAAAALLQQYPVSPRTGAGQQALAHAIGLAQWTPGLAGLAPGNATEVAANMFRIFGNQAPGQSAAINAIMNQNLMGGVLRAGANAGASVYDLQSALYSGGESTAASSLGAMNPAGIANTITPYFNAGLTAVQANAAAQTGLSGYMNISNQVMKNPLITYMYQQAAARSNPTGGSRSGLAQMLGAAYGPTVSTPIGRQMLSAYQDAWKREGPNGPLTTYYFNQLTQLAAAQGYTGVQNNILGVGRQIFGINSMGPAAALAFNAGMSGQAPADYIASRMPPLGGTTGIDFQGQTVGQNIDMGTQYIAYLQSKNPQASPGEIAAMYNGAKNRANYAKVFMQGSRASGLGAYDPGTSQKSLLADALGRHATATQRAIFKSEIPAIMQAAAANNVSPAFIARTLGLESSGGTDTSNGTNVMHMTRVAVAQLQSMNKIPSTLTAEQVKAVANAPQAAAAGLGASQAAYAVGSLALEAFNGTVNTATTSLAALGKNIDTLNGKVNRLIQSLGKRI